MMSAPTTFTIPVLCPVASCWQTIECTQTVTFESVGLRGVIASSGSVETVLAEVAAHLMAEHPEACEPAPVER